MHSTSYSDGDVGTLLTLTEVLLIWFCCVVCVLFLNELGSCGVSRQCFLSPGLQWLYKSTPYSVLLLHRARLYAVKFWWSKRVRPFAAVACNRWISPLHPLSELCQSMDVCQQTPVCWVWALVRRGLWYRGAVCTARLVSSPENWPWHVTRLSYAGDSTLSSVDQWCHNYSSLARSPRKLLSV